MDQASIAAVLGDLAREHGVPGAQLAVRWQGRTITAETGVVSAASGEPLTGEPAFPLGSLTKPFTATLAMVLADDGDIDLDEPVAEHLPALGRSPAGDVTVRQLLSHSGGMAANVEESAAGTSRQRWLAAAACSAAAHPPGTAFSYSNVGYLVLGCLVEAITGMSWPEAVESILLRPLGITPSFAVRPAGVTALRRQVPGHVVRADGAAVPVVEQTVTALEEPVAGLAASAADLLAFAGAHLDPGHGPLTEASAKAMRDDQLAGLAVGPFGIADSWGLGWSLYRGAGPEWFGHDGTGDGTWSHLRVEPSSGTVVALLTNAVTGVFLWDALVERLRPLGLDVGNHSMVWLAGPGSPVPAPGDCAGRYRNGETVYAVEAENGRLSLVVDDEPALRLTCFEDLRFTTAGSRPGQLPLLGRFVRDPASGTVDRLQLTGRLAHRSPHSGKESR